MSQRALRWTLWLAFFGLVPVPFMLAATGFAPPLRILFLASVFGAVVVADGAQGPIPIFVALLFTEAVLFGVLARYAARLVLWLFGRLAPERFVTPLVAGVVAGLLCMSFFDVYYTPHSSSGPYSNLAGLFD